MGPRIVERAADYIPSRHVWELSRVHPAVRRKGVVKAVGVAVRNQSSNSLRTGTFSPPARISIASSDGFALPRSIRLM